MKAFIILSALTLTACATVPSERANHVQVVTSIDQDRYQFVGRVHATSKMTGVLREQGYTNALNDALDQAAALGADTLVLDADSAPRYWITRESVSGQAYKRESR